MPESVEVLWSAPGHVVARWHQVFIQIRSGEMTLESLSQIETAARLMRARIAHAHDKLGALLILAPNSPPPRLATAGRQRELIRTMTADPRVHISAVIEGDSLGAMTQRAVVRTIFRSGQRVVSADVPSGALWLGRALGFEADPLVEYVRTLREKL